MDNYPPQLAPVLIEGHREPFETWWPRVKPAFYMVPEIVARDWLHRHWGYSDYAFLSSTEYTFCRIAMPLKEMQTVMSISCDWDMAQSRERGAYLVRENQKQKTPIGLIEYMVRNGEFPVPIIVLDNRDGHLKCGVGQVPDYMRIPRGLVLIEGHTRLDVALYLASIEQMKDPVDVFLMERSRGKAA